MKSKTLSVLSVALFAGVASPVYADSLLGIIGDKSDDALVTVGSGDAGSNGLVNVGVGGDSQVLDAQIGGSSDVARATVGSGSSGGVDADVNLLGGTARVNASVGGDSTVDVGVGIGGTGGGGSANPGNNGGATPGGTGGGNQFALGRGTSGAQCNGISGTELQRLMSATRLDGSWQRASNVSVRRVQICPELQTQLSAALASTGLGSSLQMAVRSDPLLSASLSRTRYDAGRVFAVQQQGNRLTVYVY